MEEFDEGLMPRDGSLNLIKKRLCHFDERSEEKSCRDLTGFLAPLEMTEGERDRNDKERKGIRNSVRGRGVPTTIYYPQRTFIERSKYEQTGRKQIDFV